MKKKSNGKVSIFINFIIKWLWCVLMNVQSVHKFQPMMEKVCKSTGNVWKRMTKRPPCSKILLQVDYQRDAFNFHRKCENTFRVKTVSDEGHLHPLSIQTQLNSESLLFPWNTFFLLQMKTNVSSSLNETNWKYSHHWHTKNSFKPFEKVD